MPPLTDPVMTWVGHSLLWDGYMDCRIHGRIYLVLVFVWISTWSTSSLLTNQVSWSAGGSLPEPTLHSNERSEQGKKINLKTSTTERLGGKSKDEKKDEIEGTKINRPGQQGECNTFSASSGELNTPLLPPGIIWYKDSFLCFGLKHVLCLDFGHSSTHVPGCQGHLG